MKPRAFLTAAVAGLVCAQALAATPPVASAPKSAPKPPTAATGPWAKVPALPTACYASQDDWYNRNEAALAAVQQDHNKQKDINTEIQTKSSRALSENPMALAQAMQQKMMDDPQNAQKYMERVMQQGQQASTDVQEDSARAQQLEAESKAILKQYGDALNKALGPANARWAALQKKRGYAPDTVGPGEGGEPDWVYAEWEAILADRDRAYAANCAQWWAATGQMHAYMKRYKDYLVQEFMPYNKRLVDDPAVDQFKMLDVPAAGYRTVGDYEAAELYMRRAYTMFAARKDRPYCGADGHCE